MGRKPDLLVKEKEHVTRALANGKSKLEIAKDMQRDHHTIKALVAASHHERKKRVQPKFRKLTERQLWQIHWQQTCRYLRPVICLKYVVLLTVRHYKKSQASKRPPRIHPLKQKHKSKRVGWAKKYMKVDFTQVIFTDECHAMLDGPEAGFNWITLLLSELPVNK